MTAHDGGPHGYVISLARRADRLARFNAALAPADLALEVVVATDGASLDLASFIPAVSPRIRESRSESVLRGIIGCKLSHEAVWRRVAGRSDGLYLVCEDDARPVHAGAVRRIRDAIDRAPADADLVWLNDYDPAAPIRTWPRVREGLDRRARRIRLGTRMQRAVERACLLFGWLSFRRWLPVVYTTTEGYLIRPAFADRLLAYSRRWVEPVDDQMRNAVDDMGATAYIVKPALLTQDDRADSDIRLVRPAVDRVSADADGDEPT
jgi:GR25 family glycosyltransferase involved in LPS biosynthesis